MTPKASRLRKHALNHASHFEPLAPYTGSHEAFANLCARTMGGDDVGDDRRKVEDGLHVFALNLIVEAPRNGWPANWFPAGSKEGIGLT